MKIAMSSYTGMGAWFVLRLMAEGHDVDYFLSDQKYEDVLSGLIPKPKQLNLDHRRTVVGYGYPSYKGYDLSLFDLTGRAKQADASKMEAPTIGDGSFEHWLEDDREAGIQAMESCEINVPPYQKFTTPTEAKAFIKKEGKRYVYKPFTIGSDMQDTATTYVADDAEDMLKVIDQLFSISKRAPFILQEFIKGTEASVAGFFNGTDFYMISCTLEEKKFMNDNKGPNTGCSGNLVFALSQESRIYREGLKRCIPMLQAAGFTGMIDLNTIITEDKIYGLEWTPRFGYLADSTIAAMYGTGYADMLAKTAQMKVPEIKWTSPFGVSIQLSIPPYPTEIRLPKAKDVPIAGLDPENLEQLCRCYAYDMKLSKDRKSLITSGNLGYICAPIGIGRTIDEAVSRCEQFVEKIQIPNMQYRTDIPKSTIKRYNFLEVNSWL
ncbi:MAG: ATP-grasp domain-containing protein [Sulfuriferula sp.]|nr:ATP-grasp domain-containing protein [Sulfuriferula sp.]